MLIAVYANMPAERRDQASRFLHLAPGHIIQMGNEIKAHAAHAGGIKLADLIAGRRGRQQRNRAVLPLATRKRIEQRRHLVTVAARLNRSEAQTSELQSLMRN